MGSASRPPPPRTPIGACPITLRLAAAYAEHEAAVARRFAAIARDRAEPNTSHTADAWDAHAVGLESLARGLRNRATRAEKRR